MKTDKCKRPGAFRFISLGDVHLGNHQTPTVQIIKNLNRCVNDELLAELDMLIITGDLYDRLLHNADDNVHHINRWITFLMYRCAKYDVMLRIVEGTPSHDRGQSRFFVEQKANASIPVDLHYATTLSIEYNERLDAHFLYVPDKWRPDTKTTLEEVRVLLKQHDLEKVDFAIMHGAFEYQLPAIVKEPTHCSETYHELVRHFILIGHVHLPTQRGRILAAGSFDRITHGEEGPKGYYDVTLRDDGTFNIVFSQNRGAKRYDTVDCHGMDTKALNVVVRTKVSELPKGSAVRLRCDPHDAATGDLELIKREYPNIDWTLLVEKTTKKKESVADTLANFDLSEFTPIDATTILTLMRPELEKHAGDPTTVERCLRRMEDFIKG
jgi:DNA repair exonuclease SbcCD nuclease subunit